MLKLWGFLGKLFESIVKTGLSLIENVLKPLAKSALIPSGLIAAVAAAAAAASTVAGIENNAYGSDMTTFRSSRSEVLLGKGVLKIRYKYRGEHSCWSLFHGLGVLL